MKKRFGLHSRDRNTRLRFEVLEQRRLLSATDVTLQISTTTGDAQLVFSGSPQLTGYQIDSATGQLAPANWHSLSSQGNADWGTLKSTANEIAEANLNSSLTGSTAIDLGQIFTVGGTHDLTFQWSNATNVSKPTVVYVTQAPDLTIGKTHTGTFKQGDTADQYTITVNNAGTAATSGLVTVTDTLPAGLTLASASGSGWTTQISGSTVTATRSDALTAGSSYPALTVTVGVAANAPASVTNTAQVSGGGETNTANDTTSDVTAITQVADLTINKSHTGSFQQGDAADTYTLTVNNVGPGPTTGTVTVTDTVPAGLTPTLASGNGWNTQISGSTLTATRSDVLAAGASYPALTLTVSVSSTATTVTNSAQVSGGGELNTSNDTASDLTTITVAAADLTISKSHTGSFKQGDAADIYSISVSNTGSLSSSGLVTVTDVLPAGLSPVSANGSGWTTSISGSTVTATRSDTLASRGAFPALTVTVSVANNAPASVINTATVAGGGEINTTNDSSSDTTTITQVADLTLSKSHTGNFRQGDSADSYTLTVHNVGSGASAGTVTVTDTIPTGLTATAASGTGWTTQINGSTVTATRSDVLASGASYPALTITVQVAGNAAASVTNTASVAGGGELITSNDTASDPTTITQVADLTISKSHSGNFREGDTGDNYTITVNNAGAGPTTGTVTVTDTLPSGLTPAAASGSGWSTQISGSTVTATRSDVLASGASYPALNITVSVAGNAAASVTNTATVAGGGELNTANDSASDPTTITAMPDLTIAKAHSGTFKQGDSADTYTITVSNSGLAPSGGTVTVTDPLPAGLTPTAASGSGWTTSISGTTVTATRSDALVAGAAYPALTITVSVAANAVASLTNTATVGGGGEINTANDSASDVTAITQVADLAISKSHSGNFRQGDAADNYTITVNNIGAGSTSGTVTVTDTLPAGLTPTASSGTGWTTSISGSTITATRSDALAGGASYPALTVTVSVAANAAASLTNTATVAGGGELNTANDSASDATTVDPAGDLTIHASHTGNFNQGDTADVYTITVSNSGPGSSSGQVTVTDTLPAGLTPTAASGSGWTTSISGSTVTATRSDVLTSGASYPALAVTVSVAGTAASSLTNTVQLSGGGDSNTSNNSASDPTTVNATSGAISGFVYFDSSNSGQRLTAQGVAKPGLSGVTVRLLSKNSQGAWAEVSGKSPVQTGAHGAYNFTSLAAGTYRLQVTPPSNFLDGTDTAGKIGGATRGTVSQDQIEVQLGGGANGTEYNFAMQGLQTRVFSLRMFLASTPATNQFLQSLVTTSAPSATSASSAASQPATPTVNTPNQFSLRSLNPSSVAAALSGPALGQASTNKNISAAAVDALMMK